MGGDIEGLAPASLGMEIFDRGLGRPYFDDDDGWCGAGAGMR